MRYACAILCLGLMAADPVDCSPEALKLYGTKVQPILANSCVACHASGKCGSFTLRRSGASSTIPSDITQANLAAALSQIDHQHAEKSKLLTKALTAHGGQQRPAFKDANVPAYKHLEQWAKMLGPPPNEPGKEGGGSKDAGAIDPFDAEIFNRGGY